VLLVDDDAEPSRSLRERDELLRTSGWNVYAALYHFLTRRHDFDLRDGLEDRDAELPPITGAEIDDFIRRRGTPPPAFHAVENPLAVEALPPPIRTDGLSDVLRRRRTTRAFDTNVALTRTQLGAILYEVFGCYGYASVRPGVDTIKRTSPSAGGLHPIEAYPLVRNVEGLAAGLYHYCSRDHSLELVKQVDDLDELAKRAVCGQIYFAGAHVLLLLTARFARNHWKYRYHQRAYATMLLDVGHLSQTLYLVATELGLGAFVTAAINDAFVDEALGLDGCTEGTLAIAGCGRAAATRSPFDPVFEPYDPRHARLS
jgi:putative peptide maturation dehydrogenase